MKPYSSFTLSRWQNIGLRALVATIMCAIAGPWGLLAAALNPDGFGTALLGASYTRINTTTKANLTDQTANIEEQLWLKGVTGPSAALYAVNPFYDQMSMSGTLAGGQVTPSRNNSLRKAIWNITETARVAGKTVHIPTYAGIGGSFVYGEGDRIGNEQKYRVGSFDVSIGLAWLGMGWTSVARDQTLIGIGGALDRIAAEGFRQQIAAKKCNDILMKMIQTAGQSGPNFITPDGTSTRADFTASTVFSTSLITKLQSRLQLIGAMPMDLVDNDGGMVASKFITLIPSDGARPLKSETAYLEAVTNADVRGDLNALFRGNYKDWDGMGLYPWEHIRHAQWDAVGSPLLPLAFLGGTIDCSGTTTGLVVSGGGSVAAAAVGASTGPKPKYYQWFSNAPYTYTNGDTIAAVTNVNRYLRITNPDGTKLVLKYLVNDGNIITLPVNSLQTVSGFTATTATVGATVEECNATGIPFCRGVTLGTQAVVCGAGSIDGSSSPNGKRTEEVRNHQSEFAIGMEYSWGCNVYKRPDDVYSGFLIFETAKPAAA